MRDTHGSARRWSVRTYLIWLVLASLLPAVAGGIALLAYEYRSARAQQDNDTLRTARALVQAVDSHLLHAQAVAATLATSDPLARGDLARFHDRAREAIERSGLATNVVLLDEAGRQLLNTAVEFGVPPAAPPAPAQVRQVFETGRPTFSDVFFGPLLRRPLMSVNVPVRIDGVVVYALSVGILPEHFDGLLKAQGLPRNWVAAVIDSQGTIVGRTHASDRFVGRKAVPALLDAMRNSTEGSIDSVTKEGIAARTSYSISPATGWRVAIGIPSAAIANELARTIGLLAAGVIAAFGVSLLLARLVSARIARSVQALTGPAQALGAGEPAAVPEVPVKEVAEVATAIGRASTLLQAKDEEIHEAHRLARLGTWHWDLKTGEVASSESLTEILGRTARSFDEMRGTVLAEETWQKLNASAGEAIRTGQGYDFQIPVTHATGEIRWLHAKARVVRNDADEAVALRGMVQDITDRKRAEQELRESQEKLRVTALHDPLTGLPNRALVFEYCDHLLSASQRNHGRGALLFIDLDRFKPINDQYGHEMGDRVLKEVGRRLQACTRQEDLVGRIGGDEFVIVLPYLDADRRRAIVVAEHVVEAVSRPFEFDGLELSLSPSVGISYFPEHATEVSALLHAADLAMYQVKQSGRANYHVYSSELDERADQARLVETTLRNALKDGGLTLHYQPVMDMATGKLVGAEALVRLSGADGDACGPDCFIPVAEATGMMAELGNWVAVEACRQHEEWLSQGLALTVSINVSPLQFRQKSFAVDLGSILDASGIDPSKLELEVAESTVMENVADAAAILKRIKSLGVRVALDDFGTGYSSLSSLTSLPIDKLKVDQSFVRGIEVDMASRVVTDAILSLGHSLRLTLHGEGIESEPALRYLREHGCNQAQGYWFSRPLAAGEFLAWSRSRQPDHRPTTADVP